jgi:CubicO group peptidase (beta-lactamase class C family)
MRNAGWVVVLLGALMPTALRAACPPRAVWPGTAWEDATEATRAARGPQIAAFEEQGFTLKGSVEERVGGRTDGAVIIHHGKLIYERYARGYTATMPHLTWSVSKSVIGAAVGVGVHKGLFTPQDSICRFRTFRDNDACRLTLQNLLEWGSGLYWRETYENGTPRVSSIGAMLYGVGKDDMAAFAADQGFEEDPGTRFNYSSGDTNLLTAAIAPAMTRALGPDWLYAGLLDEIGARSGAFEVDKAGTPVGSSYWYATPRDMARLGFLYLNDGCWNGRRLLPEGWVARSTQVNGTFLKARRGHETGDNVPGWHWWMNQAVEGVGGVPMQDVPTDLFAAEGHWGQSIWVVPSRDAVIVRTADDRDGTFDEAAFVKRALEVLP